MEIDWNLLREAAKTARRNAYIPYSGYAVGAALMSDTGNVYDGSNVENVSFGATLCAERVAIGKMASDGGRMIKAMVVRTSDGGYPCGICLQCLAEFRGQPLETQIMIEGENGVKIHSLSELVPHMFASFQTNESK